MTRACLPALALLLGGIAATAGVAAAGDDGARYRREAERRNGRANRLYERGHYEEALQLYQAAFDLHARPKYLFNIALAREKTFDYEGCAVAFRRYLESAPEEAKPRDLAASGLNRCRERAVIAVRVTSVPTNAAVFSVQGGERALKGRTPLELHLAPGTYRLAVEQAGYVPQQRDLAVEVGGRPHADFVLERLASIRIDVDPTGSQVSVDGGEWKAAPVERELRAGSHRVRVKRPGYEPADVEVKATPGRQVALMLNLKRLPILRTLRVRTDRARPGAKVAVDGEVLGAPPVAHRISPGTHRIEVAAAGAIPYADDVTIPEDRDLRLQVSLARRRTRAQKAVFWSLVGATGVAAALCGTFGVLAARDQMRFDDGPTVPLHRRGEGRAEKADLFLGGALALGAASAAYFLLTRPGGSNGHLE